MSLSLVTSCGFWEIFQHTCAGLRHAIQRLTGCPGTKVLLSTNSPRRAFADVEDGVATHSEDAGDLRRAVCQRSRNRRPRTVETLDLST